jgi:Tol biopolymer transport system component
MTPRLPFLVLALLGAFVVVATAAASKTGATSAYRAGIYSVRYDGHDHRVIAVPDPPLNYFIRSPGGRTILFLRQVGEERLALFAADSSGANPVRLTPPEFPESVALEGSPFSPDGRTIVFTGYTVCGWRCARYSLYLVGRDGTGLRLLASGATGPSWAPDSRRLAYMGSAGLYVTDIETGDTTHITKRYAYSPLWAPRGERIAYSATIGGYGVACFVNSDGSRRRCIHGHSLTNLVWSRNALRVAFRQATPLRLGTVDAGAPHVRYLGNPRSMARPVAWSPDGTQIAFAFGSYGSYSEDIEVRTLKRPRRTVRVVHEERSGLYDIRWRGNRISYVASRPEG